MNPDQLAGLGSLFFLLAIGLTLAGLLRLLVRDEWNLRDVPCGSCQVGYDGQHECDAPDYCPCDRSAAHTNELALVRQENARLRTLLDELGTDHRANLADAYAEGWSAGASAVLDAAAAEGWLPEEHQVNVLAIAGHTLANPYGGSQLAEVPD